MYQFNFLKELTVDNFAGGGGASTGIELATGSPVDIAINHDPDAIAMHKENHPYTCHYCESVWDINPIKVTNGQPVALCWFSPDCKHFSKAKGGKPVEKKIRGLAWIALRWAAMVRPRVIILENVEEFMTWGRIGKDGRPDMSYKGETFRSFVRQLRAHGYAVDWKILKACDYGSPTIRKRFFLVARCDGKHIVFPSPTHGKGKGLKAYRTAAECIDWSIPMQSIFDRKKPLAEATMRRIARGIKKYVIDNPKPFIMQMNFDNAPQDIDNPLSTVTTVGHHYVVAPTLAQMGYGETEGQKPRALDINKPLGTVTAGGNKFALVSAFLDQRYGGEWRLGTNIDKPMPTVTTVDHNQLLTVDFISHQYGTSTGQSMDEPLNAITQVNKASLVSAFLMKYYGSEHVSGQSLIEPLHTIRTKDCFCLVTVEGIDYVISDIKMRMLEPHELFMAQGFPKDYVIDRDFEGRTYSKAKQIARCGNAVCPQVAEALVRANLPELASRKKIETMEELERVI